MRPRASRTAFLLLLPLLLIAGLAGAPAAQEGAPDAAVAEAAQAAGDAAAATDGDSEVIGKGMMDRADAIAAKVNEWMGLVIFYGVPIPFTAAEVAPGEEPTPAKIPLAVLILVAGAIFFTLKMRFGQFVVFRHAVDVTAGKYDNPNDEGEINHFQALSSALSATVGLGNIGGVAIAIVTGGPGAAFWMIIAGFLGMASKLVECTLGQMYREVRPDGKILGGPMAYLSKGFAEMGMAGFGKILAVFFAVVCVGASFGGGNTFQVSQSMGAVREIAPALGNIPWAYGLVLSAAVALVILGGIKRIAATAEKIVPLMCAVYVLSAVAILMLRAPEIPAAFAAIFREAFTPAAGLGGFVGVLVTGFQRAAFSNEAGIGSAAIAHSAAKTKYPMREGIVASLGPFIDTVVICTMTALVIIITKAYNNPDPAYVALQVGKDGAALTSKAMGEVLPWFPKVLAVAVLLFAFSTMISWSYYGERCFTYLFGDKSSTTYRIIFVAFVFLGSIITAKNILDFGDLLIFGMVFPNIIGVVLLSGRVRKALDKYWQEFKAGEYPTYK
jgi:AGCS family alanine or glycine:cation symporter